MTSHDPRNLQPIAPAPPSDPDATEAGSGLLVEGTYTVPPRKRGKQIGLACDACKRRKTKCDGQRPRCHACEEKNTDCFYDVEARESSSIAGLKRKIAMMEQDLAKPQSLVRYLQQAPEHDAQEVLARLRDGAEVGDVIDSIPALRDNDMLGQAYGDAAVFRRPLGVAHRRESDRTNRSGFDPRLDQESATGSGLSPHGSDGELQATSPASKYSHQLIKMAMPTVRSPHSRLDPRAGAEPPISRSISQQKPFITLRTQPWMRVTLDNNSFADLICLWLSHHAMHLPYVYPTLFIEALIAGQPDEHCSALLVNAILALACQYSTGSASSTSSNHPREAGYNYYAESYMLWNQEEGRASLSTLQALIAMYEYNKLRGKDRTGWLLLGSAIEMGIELGICNGQAPQKDADPELVFARNFMAWSLYNYQAVESLMYRKLPRLVRCRAPRPSAPLRPSELTEKWRPYNIAVNVTRESYFWEHWNAFCSLSDIIVGLTQLLFANDESDYNVSRNRMSQCASKLLVDVVSWHSRLPLALGLDVNEMPHNIWLHMNCHLVIMSLQQPRLSGVEIRSPSSSQGSTSMQEVTKTALNIVRLTRIALEQFGHQHRTVYESQICAAAASTLIHELNTGQTQDDFLQCIAFLHRQGSKFVFPAALARALLWTACHESGLTPDADHVLVDVLKYNVTHDFLGAQVIVEGAMSSDGAQHAGGPMAQSVISKFPIKEWDMRGNDEVGRLTEVLNSFDMK